MDKYAPNVSGAPPPTRRDILVLHAWLNGCAPAGDTLADVRRTADGLLRMHDENYGIRRLLTEVARAQVLLLERAIHDPALHPKNIEPLIEVIAEWGVGE